MSATCTQPDPSAPPRLSGRHLGVRVLDLCCGMGGLSVAARELGMRVVAGMDVNHNAFRTFERNFPEAQAIEGSVQSRTVLGRCRTVDACDE